MTLTGSHDGSHGSGCMVTQAFDESSMSMSALCWRGTIAPAQLRSRTSHAAAGLVPPAGAATAKNY